MTYLDALSYIHKTEWKGSRPGLERIRTLLSLLGNPERALRFVHVAGTNGKGSVCVMLQSILTQCGLCVGLFTSPYVLEFRERIRVGYEMIPREDLVRAVEAVRPYADSMEDSPTEFELMTAVAFWYFKDRGCDVVVCEVGLGGELDSTNVICSPLLSIITSIALDHTDLLGDTMELVASAKAGIIKKGCPVLFGEEANEAALRVISDRAASLGAPLTVCREQDLSVQEVGLSGTRLSALGYRDLNLPLLGAYQPKNALIALSAVRILNGGALSIPEKAVREGLKLACHPGRFEVISREPVVILDGAHNPHGARALLDSLDACFGSEARFVCLCAVMRDKEYEALFSTLAPRMACAFCVAPQGHVRAMKEKELAAVCDKLGISSFACDTVKNGAKRALSEAKRTSRPLLVFGSLYLYREATLALRELL